MTTINSTIQGLGSAGYISSSQLLSTVTGLQTTEVGFFLSTTTGLGSAGYISSSQLLSTVGGLQSYISSFIDPAELASSVLSFISTGYLTTQLTSTVTGLGSANYISSSQLVSSMIGVTNTDGSNYSSTLKGLGSSGYISSLQLLSTVGGLQSYISSFIDPAELASSVLSFISTGYLTNQLTSTVAGLGSASYISSPQLLSTSYGLFVQIQAAAASVTVGQLASTVTGLGTTGYISSSQLLSSMTGVTNTDGSNFTSTTRGLGSSGYISSLQLLSTVGGLQSYISSFIDPAELASSVLSFISTGYLTTQLTSTVRGLGSASYISSAQLVSTVGGLTTFIGSSISSFSTAFGPGGTNMTTITSTIQGLGSSGYISSSQLLSTVGGLQTYISSFIDPAELASSVLSFISTGYLTTQLTSTVRGLGSAGYISSSALNSTVLGLGTYGYKSTILSSFNTLSVGTLTTSSILLFDSLNFNSANLVYAKSTFLYFNNYIVGGATQLQPQIFTF